MPRHIHRLDDGREVIIEVERDHSTKWVVLAILFGLVAIFTMPLFFFPLASVCLVIGFLSSLFEGRLSNIILSLVATLICAVAFVTSPTLWVAFVTLLAPVIKTNVSDPNISSVNLLDYSAVKEDDPYFCTHRNDICLAAGVDPGECGKAMGACLRSR